MRRMLTAAAVAAIGTLDKPEFTENNGTVVPIGVVTRTGATFADMDASNAGRGFREALID